VKTGANVQLLFSLDYLLVADSVYHLCNSNVMLYSNPPPPFFQKGQGLIFCEAQEVRESWLGQGKVEAGGVWKESGK
jgi:hypothetical protein